jgi:elongation factor 1-alpha
MKHMLIRVGWKDSFLDASVPILPISGWMGDNLIKKSENMGWYKGKDVKTLDGRTVHVSSGVVQGGMYLACHLRP